MLVGGQLGRWQRLEVSSSRLRCISSLLLVAATVTVSDIMAKTTMSLVDAYVSASTLLNTVGRQNKTKTRHSAPLT